MKLLSALFAALLLTAGMYAVEAKEIKYGSQYKTTLVQPSIGEGIKQIECEYALNETEIGAILDYLFPGSYFTREIGKKTGIANATMLQSFLDRKWNPGVIDKLNANGTVCFETINWMTANGWPSPVGYKANNEDYVFVALLISDQNNPDESSIFSAVKMVLSPDRKSWTIEPWIEFYLAADDQGRIVPQTISGAPDEVEGTGFFFSPEIFDAK